MKPSVSFNMSGNIALILVFTIKDCYLLASVAMPPDNIPKKKKNWISRARKPSTLTTG